MSVKSPSHYATVVLKALENEVSIDERSRILLFPDPIYQSLPNCKLIKQVALRNKLGLLYWIVIYCSLIGIPVLNICLSFFSFFRFSKKSSVQGKNIYVFATSSKSMISDIITTNESLAEIHFKDFDFLSVRRLSAGMRWRELFFAFKIILHLYRLISKQSSKLLVDLTLQSLDSYKLILFILFMEKKDQDIFMTDDHYQRWAYLMSHYAKNFTLVQHGFLDTAIEFKNKYGSVQHLYINDIVFLPEFSTYYEIENFKLFSIKLSLEISDLSETALLLASSFPFIDVEIKFLKRLTEVCKIPVIVKLHPNHNYDERKDQLLYYATKVSESHENFSSKYFVSYGSFLEFAYKQKNIRCFSIKNTNVEEIIETIKNS